MAIAARWAYIPAPQMSARLPTFARLRIDPERPDPRKLAPAVEALRRGEVIIYPTDTGYAFGCALSSSKGITTLRELKGIHEKHQKPLTMLVQSLNDIGRYGVMSNTAFRVVRRLLPGAYTIVLRATSDVPRAMKNRAHEVGVRLPDHKVCTMLVDHLGEPLLTGSVTAGEDAPELEEPEDLERRWAHRVALIIDGGHIWPEPSTVLRFDEDGNIEVLRVGQGAVPDW
jgi:tRNA threonylcarbamoyl adenosine modification protein (Sua5/YciO/YrdC/YwlC family)